MNASKRLYRSTQDRMFAGVCGGVAGYLDVDPTLVRLFFVALTLMGGPGIIIYLVLMLIVPEGPDVQQQKRKHDEEDDLSDSPEI
ncbi:MAG: PspC domain-containing protein [Chloroflexi bacterium]|nr:PspC domain-containing protein [Chloroflexota bacterium]